MVRPKGQCMQPIDEWTWMHLMQQGRVHFLLGVHYISHLNCELGLSPLIKSPISGADMTFTGVLRVGKAVHILWVLLSELRRWKRRSQSIGALALYISLRLGTLANSNCSICIAFAFAFIQRLVSFLSSLCISVS